MRAANRARKPTKRAAAAPGGVVPQTALRAKLARVGIRRDFDFVLHLPLRYEDETRIVPIPEARPGSAVQIEGEVLDSKIVFRPRRQLVARVGDESGVLTLRFFSFYPSQHKTLVAGARVRAFGEVRFAQQGPEMIHPRFHALHGEEPLPAALTPIYPTTRGLPQATLRRLIGEALGRTDLEETLPLAVREAIGLSNLTGFAAAVTALHTPPPDADERALALGTHPAWRRIKFDELLAQQLSMRRHYRERKAKRARPLAPGGTLVRELLSQLPFRLTRAQIRVWSEIGADLARAHPMHRLLQGDVGSGKTVVAALACLRAVESGVQAAVMAPTEILAEQHVRKFRDWLSPLGISVAWLTGAQSRKEREAALESIANGTAPIAVGTHALFQEHVVFDALALAVVDEQHRFGVMQRLALRGKGERRLKGSNAGGVEPHLLMMSATPIPRTLSMSYYADLDVSVIDEMPPGRRPVVTKLVADTRRQEVMRRIRAACGAGHQAYWVCPLIEESDALQLKTALETHAALAGDFPELGVGLVHGRMSAVEKAEVMSAFAAGELQLLVATTVIEVGVDIANATLMVIEHAERFGLAQLHQLRGRIGRGAAESVCILLYQNPLGEAARRRLQAIYESTDGFEIARQDLLARGPGEYLGSRQSGAPLLRFADTERDQDLLAAARQAAELMLAEFPREAQQHLDRWLGGRSEFLKA
ncbi:MAG: ATP-dependent DNA helicase RecG [Betaproteobacteria bacterium RIFCSPLOWO2_12_FULL_63_13]|nr:MAG: ATP-dependent DNA helicase RecG [Betaproteobacteria bacterium RIFCSPLOWO2_12_FULL_63_13]